VFVELKPGIGGMIHISDLSWLKRLNNPSEYTKVGEPIEVIILNIDKDGRKLQLGHKQLEEDPWISLGETFPVGSIHEGTVIRKDDKGAVVSLPYGLEGFAPSRHLGKEEGTNIAANELVDREVRLLLTQTRLDLAQRGKQTLVGIKHCAIVVGNPQIRRNAVESDANAQVVIGNALRLADIEALLNLH